MNARGCRWGYERTVICRVMREYISVILEVSEAMVKYKCECTIASKINGTGTGVYLPFSKLLSILALANLLVYNNIRHICYCCQISLQSVAVNCSYCDNMTHLGIPFTLLSKVHLVIFFGVSNEKDERENSMLQQAFNQ